MASREVLGGSKIGLSAGVGARVGSGNVGLREGF